MELKKVTLQMYESKRKNRNEKEELKIPTLQKDWIVLVYIQFFDFGSNFNCKLLDKFFQKRIQLGGHMKNSSSSSNIIIFLG